MHSAREGAVAATHDDAEERELLAAVAAGSRAAAERLVDRTYARVFALLARLCDGDDELAADLTQETYRKAWAALATFESRARFSTWLYRIAYNTFLNHARAHRHAAPLEEDATAALVDDSPGADDDLSERQLEGRLRQAVLRLPETLRTAVAARYWADVPVAEIARAEGVSETAVRKRLGRALRALGEALAGALGGARG